MIGAVARSQTRVSTVPALVIGERAARVSAGLEDRMEWRVWAPRARGATLDGAFSHGGKVVAQQGPRDIHAAIADFIRDNEATLSRCRTADQVADVVTRTGAQQRWVVLAATTSRDTVRARARQAAMRAGLPPASVDAIADGVALGAGRVVVEVTVRRPLERAYAEALTRRNALIESTTGDGALMKANDRLIHDMPRADLTRIDPAFTQMHVDTAALGLSPRQFPFATAAADTLARAAVLEAIAGDPATNPREVALLGAAARLARETAPDELDLLRGDQ